MQRLYKFIYKFCLESWHVTSITNSCCFLKCPRYTLQNRRESFKTCDPYRQITLFCVSFFPLLQNNYRLILFLNFHMQYIIIHFIYICLSWFISLPLKAKPPNKTNKTPVVSQSTGRALFKIHSTEIKIENILNLM